MKRRNVRLRSSDVYKRQVSDVEYLIEDPTVRAGALMILGLISGVVGLVSLAITVFLKNVVEVGQ